MRVTCPRCGTGNAIDESQQAGDGRVRTRCTECNAKLLIKVNRPDLKVADDIPATPDDADDAGLAGERIAPISEIEIEVGEGDEPGRDTWRVVIVHELQWNRVGDLRRALLGLPRFKRNANKMQDVTSELPYVIPDLSEVELDKIGNVLNDAGARWLSGARHALLDANGELRGRARRDAAPEVEADQGRAVAGEEGGDEGDLVLAGADEAEDGLLVAGDEDSSSDGMFADGDEGGPDQDMLSADGDSMLEGMFSDDDGDRMAGGMFSDVDGDSMDGSMFSDAGGDSVGGGIFSSDGGARPSGDLSSADGAGRVVAGDDDGLVVAGDEEGFVVASDEDGLVGAGDEEGFVVAGDEDGRVVAGDEDGLLVASDEDGLIVAGDEDGLLVASDEDGLLVAADEDGLLVAGDEDGLVVAGDEDGSALDDDSSEPAGDQAAGGSGASDDEDGGPMAVIEDPESTQDTFVVDDDDDPSTDAAAEALFGPAITREKVPSMNREKPGGPPGAQRPLSSPPTTRLPPRPRGQATEAPVVLSTLTAPEQNAEVLDYVSALVVLSAAELAGAPDSAVTRAIFQVRSELRRAARERGGNAVWGVRTSHSSVGGGATAGWMVMAEGTAVRTR